MYQPTISYTDARRLVAGGAQLVDVRNPMEHQRGALPGKVLQVEHLKSTKTGRAQGGLDLLTQVLEGSLGG